MWAAVVAVIDSAVVATAAIDSAAVAVATAAIDSVAAIDSAAASGTEISTAEGDTAIGAKDRRESLFC